jgi:phosphatidylinositol alpha-mannosyltransferase
MAGRHRECFRCNAGQGWFGARKLWLMTFVRRFLCKRVAINITPTARLGGLLGLARTVAIPHGLQAIAPVAAVSENSARRVITFQGRLVTTKGVGVLFEAARKLSEAGRAFELLVIGDGPERAALERLAQESSLAGRVRFTGKLTGGELDAALAQSSVVVVPSLGGEVFGLVVAENLSRGLPVIVSDLGAFVEVVGEGGVTFRTGDAAMLATAITKVLDDPSFAAQLRLQARQRALEFCDYQRMLDAHAKVYGQALRRPVRAGR